MRLEDYAAGLLILATITYAVLGGADFGGGIWDAFAFGPRRTMQRDAIAGAMGPVWEANHVWLIFMVVVLFTAFPAAYAAVCTQLFLPLHFVLVGIVLRGAAFVFRAYSPRTTGHASVAAGRWGVIFGASSLITPFLLGSILGALSSGDAVRTAWLRPVPSLFGAFAVAFCAYLAAVYLCVETVGELQADFRKCALAAGTACVVLSGAALPFLHNFAPHLVDGLISIRAAPVLATGVIAALLSGFALLRKHYRVARVATVIQTAALLAGWAIAQHPYLLYPTLTVYNVAAPPATLRFLLIATPIGMLVLVPSLWYLFRVFKATT